MAAEVGVHGKPWGPVEWFIVACVLVAALWGAWAKLGPVNMHGNKAVKCYCPSCENDAGYTYVDSEGRTMRVCALHISGC